MAPYSIIAEEYYDDKRHPTCANFEQLSRLFLNPELEKLLPDAQCVVELGAGRSLVAPVMATLKVPLRNLVLVDISPAMLQYSATWGADGARLLVADAQRTGLPTGVADLIVSSLGDPYNTPLLWNEIARLLSENGMCLFTSPASEWADAFRPVEGKGLAQFVLADGRLIEVPSFVPTNLEQANMINAAGLDVVLVRPYFATDVNGFLSPKLSVANQDPVLRAYKIRRPGR